MILFVFFLGSRLCAEKICQSQAEMSGSARITVTSDTTRVDESPFWRLHPTMMHFIFPNIDTFSENFSTYHIFRPLRRERTSVKQR